jgi:exoribonuclease R
LIISAVAVIATVDQSCAITNHWAGADVIGSRDELAHQLAAGFLEKASIYAARHGQECLQAAMEKALGALRAEYELSEQDRAARAESEAVLLACEIARITLAANGRQAN